MTPKDELTAFYFCNRQDQQRNTALTLVRGLMYLLLEAQPDLIEVVLADFRRFKQHNSLFDIAHKETLWRNFEQMLRITSIRTIYFILDALDECEETSLAWLLPKLTGLMTLDSSSTLKIVITSRRIPVILPESLHRFPQVMVDQNSNLENDLQLFVAHKVRELAEKKSSVEENLEERERVHDKWLAAMEPLASLPHATFLWVSFAVRDLEQSYLSEVDRKLRSLPRDLDGYYAQMLRQISQRGEQQAAVAARIMSWVVMAMRPLSLLELSIAAETLPTNELSREEAMADHLRFCGYFLKLNAGIVSPVHQSVRDFLINLDQSNVGKDLARLFRIDEAEVHLEIASSCFQYIQGDGIAKGPFSDDHRVHLSPSNITDPESEKLKRFPFLQYAALHWPIHAQSSSHPEVVFDLRAPFYQAASHIREAWLHSYWQAKMPGWQLPDKSFDLLHMAVFFGLLNVVDVLLDRKNRLIRLLDIEHYCNLRMEPLHWAVRNVYEDVTKLLIDRGANISPKGYGLTPLIWAVRNSHEAILRLLISRGAELNDKAYGMTALHWAAWDGREDMVRVLLDQGADPALRTSSQDIESVNHAADMDDGEFPWATMDEANQIFQVAEAKDSLLYAKKEFWFCAEFGAYFLANCSNIVLILICLTFTIPGSLPPVGLIWAFMTFTVLGVVVGITTGGCEFAIIFMGLQGFFTLLIAFHAWYCDRSFSFPYFLSPASQRCYDQQWYLLIFFKIILIALLGIIGGVLGAFMYEALTWAVAYRRMRWSLIILLSFGVIFFGHRLATPLAYWIHVGLVAMLWGSAAVAASIEAPVLGRTAAELATARGFAKISNLLEEKEAAAGQQALA